MQNVEADPNKEEINILDYEPLLATPDYLVVQP